MKCAICQKRKCVCGCDQYEEDDSPEWDGTMQPRSQPPYWFTAGFWFLVGMLSGILTLGMIVR